MKRRRVLVTGGTGFVGRFVVERLITEGHDVVVLGRTPPPHGFFSRPVRFVAAALEPGTDFVAACRGVDACVHAAFDHLPGRYRGGEGDNPEVFRRRNEAGSLALFEAAKRAGVGRAVFLSSRAAYGEDTTGAMLREDTSAGQPPSLYGRTKLAVENALHDMTSPRFVPVSLRLTGVYGPAGPGRAHKWTGLFTDYLAGKPIEPRSGTEVHGNDAAEAANLVLNSDAAGVAGKVFNVSDIVVGRRDILEIVRAATGSTFPLPDRASSSGLGIMATDRLRALGWHPGGWPLLQMTVEALAMQHMRR